MRRVITLMSFEFIRKRSILLSLCKVKYSFYIYKRRLLHRIPEHIVGIPIMPFSPFPHLLYLSLPPLLLIKFFYIIQNLCPLLARISEIHPPYIRSHDTENIECTEKQDVHNFFSRILTVRCRYRYIEHV